MYISPITDTLEVVKHCKGDEMVLYLWAEALSFLDAAD